MYIVTSVRSDTRTKKDMNKKITITHVIVGLDRGGAEMMLRRLIEENICSGSHDVHSVISLTNLGYHGDFIRQQGVAVYAMGMDTPRGLLQGWFDLVLLLRKLKPDIVQTWMVHSDFLGGLAARLAGVPRIIWGVRTTDYSIESSSTRAVRWLCARLSRVVPDMIVCAAQASLESSAKAGYAVEKLMVIPNGFDEGALRLNVGTGEVVRQMLGISTDSLVVGCLGRYHPAKDHANFVQAAGRLAAHNQACHFLMVGRNLTIGNAELMGLIQATGFVDRFVLLGERSDPSACLDAMDVFVLSSNSEGFPNVLGEAMSMGVPCVSTNVGDAAVLLGDAGEIVPARNSLALAAAVRRLLEMPLAERQSLGEKGRERIKRDFSMATAARRFADLYASLAARC
jgi:glycosyltransferase involved in cell wall biosynthesis